MGKKKKKKNKDVMSYHVGDSNYSKKKIQPWDIWEEYLLDPFRADIIKRTLRTKGSEDPVQDMNKIIHICEKIKSLYKGGIYFELFKHGKPKKKKRHK